MIKSGLGACWHVVEIRKAGDDVDERDIKPTIPLMAT